MLLTVSMTVSHRYQNLRKTLKVSEALNTRLLKMLRYNYPSNVFDYSQGDGYSDRWGKILG